jgi:putative alpha-1,2-mannosidase
MKILIKALAKSQWEVRLDQKTITFRSEAEARAFAETLQARIQAPHTFPVNQQRAAAG